MAVPPHESRPTHRNWGPELEVDTFCDDWLSDETLGESLPAQGHGQQCEDASEPPQDADQKSATSATISQNGLWTPSSSPKEPKMEHFCAERSFSTTSSSRRSTPALNEDSISIVPKRFGRDLWVAERARWLGTPPKLSAISADANSEVSIGHNAERMPLRHVSAVIMKEHPGLTEVTRRSVMRCVAAERDYPALPRQKLPLSLIVQCACQVWSVERGPTLAEAVRLGTQELVQKSAKFGLSIAGWASSVLGTPTHNRDDLCKKENNLVKSLRCRGGVSRSPNVKVR